jgi:hypothetical protein
MSKRLFAGATNEVVERNADVTTSIKTLLTLAYEVNVEAGHVSDLHDWGYDPS